MGLPALPQAAGALSLRPPFSRIAYGIPFDTPEAEVRRSATESVTEVLLAQNRFQANPQLALLARMTHLYEVTPWMRPADPPASQFGQELIAATGRCSLPDITPCVKRAFHYMDTWYLQKR